MKDATPNLEAQTKRYQDALRLMPPSGGGGCHPALLRVANFGRLAGVDPDQVARDLAAHVSGTRRVTGAEIEAAVNKAFDSASVNLPTGNTRAATPRPVVDGSKLLDSILKRGTGSSEADLSDASPVRIDWPSERAATEFLSRMFEPNEHLFIGARSDAGAGHVLPMSRWIAQFKRGTAIPELIIPNPLTGEEGQTKDGKRSYRADSCVAQFRFAVVEFDAMPREQQIRFWFGAPLPVAALVDSGGKSIHGWVRIDAADATAWSLRVEEKLFTLLTAVGVDAACKNEARLSRMPGHFRGENKRWQRVLYLNPAGAPILP